MVVGRRALRGYVVLALALVVGAFVAGRVTAPASSSLLATSAANEAAASYSADQLERSEARAGKAESSLAAATSSAAKLRKQVADLTTTVEQVRAAATAAAATATPPPTVPATASAQEVACGTVQRAQAQALLVFADWTGRRLAAGDVEGRLRVPADALSRLSAEAGDDAFGRQVKAYSATLTDYLSRWVSYGPFTTVDGIVEDVRKGVPDCP